MTTDPAPTDRIAAIRSFNRFYTKHLGVLEDGFMQSEFSLTEARILYELGRVDSATATDLQAILGHNAGYLSRVLRRLRRADLIASQRSTRDGRAQLLSLTPSGREVFERLDRRSNEQIQTDLGRLPEFDQSTLATAMTEIHRLLCKSDAPTPAITLRTHRPGDIGWIIQKHGELYTEEFAWSSDFEMVVGEIATAFLKNFDPERERCWIAERGGIRVGTIMLVNHPDHPGVAKLRLLLVDPSVRGLGLGRQLVDTCIAFAREAGYATVTLWTMNMLKGARHIYQKTGFRLVDEEPVLSFGHEMISETWELTL